LRFSHFVFLILALANGYDMAQTRPGARVTQPIDDETRVVLAGNVHPLAQARYDQGAVPDSFPAQRMMLLLRRSSAQETALRRFLEDAHTPGKPDYHKWLTPQQFGASFGPDDGEIAAVDGWLRQHGFSVARVTAGKTAIEFSGTAGQLRDAFHTEIHSYVVNGEEHHANNRDPEIPAALAPVIAGIAPINDFRPRSYAVGLGHASYNAKTNVTLPQWTLNPISSPQLALAPGDFAMQYDLNPLYRTGTNGTGVTIGIIGASSIDPDLAARYRTLFGLPAKPVNIIVDGEDPGVNGAYVESYLDVEVAGSVAPDADIDLYTAADTTLQSGLYLAAQRAVDEDVAAVLSMSYGVCEKSLGAAGNRFWAALWEQAAAQGQTAFVSAGDGGGAGCDDFDETEQAQYGLAVNGFGSTPWNVSVGGTDFYYSSYNSDPSAQTAQLATYWNMTPTAEPAVSLLQPTPEQAWNRAFGLNVSDGGVYFPPYVPTIVAGSGGASSCTAGKSASDGGYSSCAGGYAKPAWQSGAGVPKDGARDLPDVSLFAAAGENWSFYPICADEMDCVEVQYGTTIYGVGGTSASAPAMAGIMALIDQKYGAQGQADFVLYPLATQQPSVFHDITIGGNVVPCMLNTPSCTKSAHDDNTSGYLTLGHYYAGTGYDQATGLGSVDADLLVKEWKSVRFTPTSTRFSLSKTTFAHGTPVKVNVDVSGSGGTPTGTISLVTASSPEENRGWGDLPLESGTAEKAIDDLPGGEYEVIAKYSGDTKFAPSTSDPVTVDITPEASNVDLSGMYYECNGCNAITFLPFASGATFPYGVYIAIDAQPRGASAPQGAQNGIATGSITITDTSSAGNLYTGSLSIDRMGIAEWGRDPGFTVGSHSVSASYSGDASFAASSSAAPVTFNITKGASQLFFNQEPGLIDLGSAATVSVDVGIPPSVIIAPPTGLVTFSSGGKVLGTAALNILYGSPGFSYATFSMNGLPLGKNTISVEYAGDANFTPVSGTTTVLVAVPPRLTASSSPDSINESQNFTVAAKIAGVKGEPTPTGGVLFLATDEIGNSWSAGGQLEKGAASFEFDAWNFVPGTVKVAVSYYGDSVYGPAQTSVPVKVTLPYKISGESISIPTPGATTGNSSTITVTPLNGFTGNVYLGCKLVTQPTGAQNLPVCSIASQVSLSGTSAVTTALSVTSTAATSGALDRRGPGRPWVASSGGAVLAIVWLVAVPSRRRRLWRVLPGVLCLLVLFGCLAGCGVWSKTTSPTGPSSPGTTPGSYIFAVTASFQPGGLETQTIDVKVTIN
jgi:trimeric autotransporter adhesin